MNPNTEVVDGILVTKCDVCNPNRNNGSHSLLLTAHKYPQPTEEWTNDYQQMGGDEVWGEGGKVSEVLERHGLSGDIKPLFALDAESGAPYTLFELGGTFYFFNASDDSLERITYPTALGEILGYISYPDAGLDDILTKPV